MSSMNLKAALASLIVAVAPAALAHGPETHSPVGEPGKAAAVTRTIEVRMSDTMRFHPEKISVRRGETVRFVVKNDGLEPHEFMLGEIKALQEHAEVMRKHPTMVHDEPNAITVNPSQTGELIWKFTTSGRVDFACLIPGHFEKGMKGDIRVSQ
ncbi:MAG: cupredoxin family protein [Alphaproteobacteria bacterium]|nr:cupredoxin family protein [Alphaproteobacteria bacterium]